MIALVYGFFFFDLKEYYLVLRNENVFFLHSLLFLTAKSLSLKFILLSIFK